MTHTVSSIAAHVEGEVVGDGSLVLTGIASAAEAAPGELTFAENAASLAIASAGRASAVLSFPGAASPGRTLIRVPDARLAVARLLPVLHPPDVHAAGIHPTAVVDPTAQVDPAAHVGPHCVIGAGAVIGPRAALLGGNHIGRGTRIGEDTVLFPNVVVYHGCTIGRRVAIHAGTVIGADGYGYAFDQGRHRKVLQVGCVQIGDDVEIGANTCIDRAALSVTSIGAGTKIDNLVHIAHNVTVGRHCLIMGQCGFAGSTTLGDYTVVASQSGIAGHLKIGRQVVIGGKSGVMRDIPDKTTVLGMPAVPDKQAKRQWISIERLPELLRRVREIEDRLGPPAGPA